MSIKSVFVEGPNRATDKTRELVSRRLQRAFVEIDRELQAGRKDKAATAANYAGQELDQMMRDLSQSILGGSK